MTVSKPRLAVIGTGIAGLSATWLLRDHFDVTVYEAQPRAGMGVHTIDYVSNGIESRIDIPLRIFCRGYYDNLLALYNAVGVEVLASDHSGAFADGEGNLILHYGNADFGFGNFSYLKGSNLLKPRAWKIALQSRRFFARASRDVAKMSNLPNITFGDYLKLRASGEPDFLDTVMLPMMSVTCTCDYETVLAYPADIMLGYLTCGVHELGIMSAAKGVDDIVPRLLAGADVKTDCAISSISDAGDKLQLKTVRGDADDFDQVIVAAQAHQAAAMLTEHTDLRVLLETIPFESSDMSVHTDTDILPEAVNKMSPVTYHLPSDSKRSEVSVDLTKAIPRLSGQETVFQTWNPLQPIAANKELVRVGFTRPAVTLESRRVVGKLREIQSHPGNRLHLCGSYMADKIPLLEAAVDSSVAIAEQLGVIAPWKQKAA